MTLSRTAHFQLLAALLGIPIAGFSALLFSLQISRLLYGKADAVFLALECASLLAWAALVLRLRSRLAESPEPGGLYRDLLDFFALARWHPAATLGLIALLVLPFAWIALGNRWMFNRALHPVAAPAAVRRDRDRHGDQRDGGALRQVRAGNCV